MVLRSCPTCGSRRVKYVISDLTVRVGKDHRVRVPAVRKLRCLQCGEVVYDAEAAQVIDHYLSKDPVWLARRRALFQKVVARRRLAA